MKIKSQSLAIQFKLPNKAKMGICANKNYPMKKFYSSHTGKNGTCIKLMEVLGSARDFTLLPQHA